jgi:cation diffusion facilitator family transporter
MSKFPESIPLPESVSRERRARRRAMTRTAKRGVLIRCSIIAAELMGFAYLGSSALLLDALSSLFDVASSLFLILCIKIADRPPDEEHPFGHGRFEPIAGLQLGLLLVVIGGGMLFQQISALTTGELQTKVINPHTWIIPFAAVILLEACYHFLRHTAKRQNSPALMSDAVHYRVDSINSAFAMIALVFAAKFPQYSVMIDHLGAVVIACLMIGIGAYAARNNIHQLLDRIPEKKYFDLVKTAALRVKGVLATEKMRLQVYGPDAHVSIDIEVEPALSVETAHQLTQQVRAEIQKEWPAVRDVIVHVEPYFPNDHEEI